jgi:hypothetical protein
MDDELDRADEEDDDDDIEEAQNNETELQERIDEPKQV